MSMYYQRVSVLKAEGKWQTLTYKLVATMSIWYTQNVKLPFQIHP